MREFILGGARSGKSALAERLAAESGLAVTYIATAGGSDTELARRIERHAARRPALAERLEALAAPERCLLVDCLTLWLTNLLLLDDPRRLERACAELLEVVPQLPGHLIFVSNETGLGVVPLGELTRRYVDAAGELHQALAARCERVVLTVAGLPLTLKGTPL